VFDAAVPVPAPKVFPERRVELSGCLIGKRDEIAAVIVGQIECVPVVGGDDHPETIENVIFPKIFFVYPQRVRRNGQRALGVLVETVAAGLPLLTHVSRLANAQDHPAQKFVVLAEQLTSRHVTEIPGSDRRHQRFKQCVLADPGLAAQHDGVVGLYLRSLHPRGHPGEQVFGVVRVKLAPVVDPSLRLASVAGHNIRRAVGVQRRGSGLANPTAVDRKLVFDELRFAGYPGERFDALVFF
jgi:hypothetical protein